MYYLSKIKSSNNTEWSNLPWCGKLGTIDYFHTLLWYGVIFCFGVFPFSENILSIHKSSVILKELLGWMHPIANNDYHLANNGYHLKLRFQLQRWRCVLGFLIATYNFKLTFVFLFHFMRAFLWVIIFLYKLLLNITELIISCHRGMVMACLHFLLPAFFFFNTLSDLAMKAHGYQGF